MGAKTWMLVYADSNAREALKAQPQLDRAATLQLAHKLFSGEKLEPLEDGDLSYTCPADDELHIGCFAGLSVIAAREFGIDYPSALPQAFIEAGGWFLIGRRWRVWFRHSDALNSSAGKGSNHFHAQGRGTGKVQ